MRALFACDQCLWEEWREEHEEATLCPACGYMRWQLVRRADDGATAEGPGTPGGDRDPTGSH